VYADRVGRTTSTLLRLSAFGLVLGVVSLVGIVWSNVVVPSHESDSEYAVWYLVFYVGLLFYFSAAGLYAARGKTPVASGALAGLASAVTFAVIALTTFIVIDNLFLDIVMTQPDKLDGFRHSGLQSAREYVNQGNGMAVVTALPLMAVVGAGCGAMGGLLRLRLFRRPPTV
jgi:hypothetical protein